MSVVVQSVTDGKVIYNLAFFTFKSLKRIFHVLFYSVTLNFQVQRPQINRTFLRAQYPSILS